MKSSFRQLIDNISYPFDSFKSDYLMNKWLIDHGFLEECVQFLINESVGTVMHHGDVVYDDVNTKGVLLPLKFQFKKYFEKPNVFQETLRKINSFPEDYDGYVNFINGKLWKQKVAEYSSDICIPFFYISTILK